MPWTVHCQGTGPAAPWNIEEPIGPQAMPRNRTATGAQRRGMAGNSTGSASFGRYQAHPTATTTGGLSGTRSLEELQRQASVQVVHRKALARTEGTAPLVAHSPCMAHTASARWSPRNGAGSTPARRKAKQHAVEAQRPVAQVPEQPAAGGWVEAGSLQENIAPARPSALSFRP